MIECAEMEKACLVRFDAICKKMEESDRRADLKLEVIRVDIQNSKDALVMARTNMEARLHGMNDLQHSLDLARTENGRNIAELSSKMIEIEKSIVRLTANQEQNMGRLSTLEGKREGEGKGIGQVMVFVSLVIGLLNAFYLIFHAIK